VMDKYGGACTCCGERHVAFLTIDHVAHDGQELRDTGVHSGGGSFYKKLSKLPVQSGLRVLCYNCNSARRVTGTCPHVDDTYIQQALTRGKYERRPNAEMLKPRVRRTSKET
jgi:hypothetical protein